MRLFDLQPSDTANLLLVAERMRQTLVEVEGEEQGGGMYSMQWLQDRVRWHLDPAATTARVVLAEVEGAVVGHTIVRIERPEGAAPFGLVSTTYVLRESRRLGIAQALLSEGQAWFQSQGVATCCTWTSSTNTPLIKLYARNGFVEVERGPNDLTGTAMVRLGKTFSAVDTADAMTA